MSMQMRDYAKQERPYVINLDLCEVVVQWLAGVGIAMLSAYIFWMGFCEVTQ